MLPNHDRTCGLLCCWMCGADHGDYDEFVGQTAVLCFMEPLDPRFPSRAGYQVKCGICAVGTMQLDDEVPKQGKVAVRVGTKRLFIAYAQ